MRSEAYEDWLHAWELLRDHADHITTFGSETLFHLDIQDCSVTDMLENLDMAAQCRHRGSPVDGTTRRNRSVGLHAFPRGKQLDSGELSGYEAESLWELGQTEQAEALFQVLTETFPNFAWGHLVGGLLLDVGLEL